VRNVIKHVEYPRPNVARTRSGFHAFGSNIFHRNRRPGTPLLDPLLAAVVVRRLQTPYDKEQLRIGPCPQANARGGPFSGRPPAHRRPRLSESVLFITYGLKSTVFVILESSVKRIGTTRRRQAAHVLPCLERRNLSYFVTKLAVLRNCTALVGAHHSQPFLHRSFVRPETMLPIEKTSTDSSRPHTAPTPSP